MAYNFARRADIEATLEMIRAPRPTPSPPASATRVNGFASEGYILKTPAGGIDARSGDTVSSAQCEVYAIDNNSNLIPLPSVRTGETLKLEVFNVFSSAIGGDAYITAKLVFNRLVADAEDCG